MVMKSLEILKNDIYKRMNEISNFAVDSSNILNEDGTYDYDELNAYFARNKKRNYMKAACMRLIKIYLIRKYGEWSFCLKDYPVYVEDFKKFG